MSEGLLGLRFYVGLAAAMLNAGCIFAGSALDIPPAVIAGAVAIISWGASMIVGRRKEE